jgi:hypothetical protein
MPQLKLHLYQKHIDASVAFLCDFKKCCLQLIQILDARKLQHKVQKCRNCNKNEVYDAA